MRKLCQGLLVSQGLGSDSHWGLGGLLGDEQLGPKEGPMRRGLEGLGDDRMNIWYLVVTHISCINGIGRQILYY